LSGARFLNRIDFEFWNGAVGASDMEIRSPKFFPRIYRKDKPSHRLSTAYLLNVFFGPASTVKRFTSSTVQRDQEGAQILEQLRSDCWVQSSKQQEGYRSWGRN